MIIAHISDPHHGPQFVEKAYAQAVKEIRRLQPDVVVASGDFTENGIAPEYESAARHLLALKDFPLVTCPGNHDYRSTGYLPYTEIFGERRNLTSGNVTFFPMGTARPDRDEGEVGRRQNVWLEQALKEAKDRVRVIVMHHHLVPVPDTGTDRTTVLVDAGDTLKSVTSAGAELVLCGHRHRPWMWEINGTPVAHAGTVSSQRTRGFLANTYNIIELNESSGKATVWLKIVGGKKIPMRDVVTRTPYYTGLKLPKIGQNPR